MIGYTRVAGAGGGGGTYELPARVSGYSQRITSSSHDGSFYDWGAFNGVSPTDLRSPQSNTVWSAGQNEANAYIQVDLGTAYALTKVQIVAFSNYSEAWEGTIKIEGSNDGTTWTSVLSGGASTMEFTAPYQQLVPQDITVSGTYRYVRITGVDPFTVYYNPSCFFDEIYIYCTDAS